MMKELLEWSMMQSDNTIIMCGDFNTYAEEGRNPENDWEAPGRYEQMMILLKKSGFLKIAGRGRPILPDEVGLPPKGAVPEAGSKCRDQQPSFITFPNWTDQSRHFDSYDHQLDYFFVRPRAGVDLEVKQIV